jgi:hypothetical protein
MVVKVTRPLVTRTRVGSPLVELCHASRVIFTNASVANICNSRGSGDSCFILGLAVVLAKNTSI